MNVINRRDFTRLALAAPSALAAAGCAHHAAPRDAPTAAPSSGSFASVPMWPGAASTSASADFWRVWGDGRAELTGYDAVTPRYGYLRSTELALIYVTEPLDRRTLIKDDDAPAERRLPTLKLNISEKFQTGVYPYSILTSVFCPVDGHRAERFAPAKITLTAQEWCGHVFAGVWPDDDSFLLRQMSYFAAEGEYERRVVAPGGVLFEDALLVQLRELDGAFNQGRDWEGPLVPSLWRGRRSHQPLSPTPARVVRSQLDSGTTRFELVHGSYRREFDIESGGARRVLGWRSNDGARARLRATTRLAYWELNHPGDESRRSEFGLDATAPPLVPPPAGERVGF